MGLILFIYLFILYQEEGVFKSPRLKMETTVRRDEEIQAGIV